MSGAIYTDYQFKFSNLVQGLAGIQALGAAGLFDVNALPQNALGSPRDNTGALVADPTTATWVGGQGMPASSYTDSDTQQVVQVPATGDGSSFYIGIRSEVATIAFDPSAYGMTVSDPMESASVLGVWAS